MIARGKAMLKRYAEPLAKIEQRFGVPGPVLVAIWGLETGFGADNGAFPTFTALATLPALSSPTPLSRTAFLSRKRHMVEHRQAAA